MTVEQVKELLVARMERFDRAVDNTTGRVSDIYLTKYVEVVEILEAIDKAEKEGK